MFGCAQVCAGRMTRLLLIILAALIVAAPARAAYDDPGCPNVHFPETPAGGTPDYAALARAEAECNEAKGITNTYNPPRLRAARRLRAA